MTHELKERDHMNNTNRNTEDVAKIVLNPGDPFEKVLVGIIETNRRKRADYAADGEIFSNFYDTSHFAGFENAWLSALFNCQQKLSRISSLRSNGRLNDPANEAVGDTLLDHAVYAVIAYAIFQDEIDKGV